MRLQRFDAGEQKQMHKLYGLRFFIIKSGAVPDYF